MQNTSGVGLSDFACQKSSTLRSCLPYETLSAVGLMAGTGSFFSTFFSSFFSSFFSCAWPPARASRSASGNASIGPEFDRCRDKRLAGTEVRQQFTDATGSSGVLVAQHPRGGGLVLQLLVDLVEANHRG